MIDNTQFIDSMIELLDLERKTIEKVQKMCDVGIVRQTFDSSPNNTFLSDI